MQLLDKKQILQFYFSHDFSNLESKTGLDTNKKARFAYGLNKGAVCSKCAKRADESELRKCIKNGQVLSCQDCGGPIKPEIKFIGEELTNNFKKIWQLIEDPETIRASNQDLNKVLAGSM